MTIRKCFEVEINHLDTAHVYGPNGESENLIRRAIEGRRDELVIATKCGIHYEGSEMVTDGRPATRCGPNVRSRCGDWVPIALSFFYLHTPDENVPLADSAGMLRELMAQGRLGRSGYRISPSNSCRSLQRVCPIAAVQPPYNMLLRVESEQRGTIPWCREHNVAVMVYWPLMKGILAGKITRATGLDPRTMVAVNTPATRARSGSGIKSLSTACARPRRLSGHTVAQEVVVNWTFSQPGITSAACLVRSDRIKTTRRPGRWDGN